MPILATLPGVNLFTPKPSNPRIDDPNPSKPLPPPIPIPKYPKPAIKTPPPNPKNPPNAANPALKSVHYRTKYYKPVRDGVIASETDGRSVIIGESGVSYLLPGAPFEFQFSYSETPKVKPLAIREPAFLPFAPPTMPRPWTGKAPLKKSKKKIPLFDSFNSPSPGMKGVKHVEMPGPIPLGKYPKEGMTRVEILGEPLTKAEIRELVKPCWSGNRQVNLGRDGLTHNMLELVHAHWKRQRVCKVRCRGVPTVDMDNVCQHLEEKTGGKIIYRVGGVVYLFRGRNYNYRTRPQYPIMLWKPAAPVYPKLIQEAPEGLTKIEADDLRRKGENLPPICKLAKNGIYINLVKDVRDAFEGSPLVKVNCQGLEPSDYKKIGAKLKELVPCVLLSFDQEQILMWRGKDWKSMYEETSPSASNISPSDPSNKDAATDDALSEFRDNCRQSVNSGKSDHVDTRPIARTAISSPRIMSLWKCALESSKALFLDEINLGPDALLEKVEEFEGRLQVTEHSYPALISPRGSGHDGFSKPEYEGESDIASNENRDEYDEYSDEEDDHTSDCLADLEAPTPLGSLPVDSLVERLSGE